MWCTGDTAGRGSAAGRCGVAAREHLRGFDLFVEPRKQWPSGWRLRVAEGPDRRRSGRLVGRALSVMGDGGWGRLVATGTVRGRVLRRRAGGGERRADPRDAGGPTGAHVGDVRAVDDTPRPGAGVREAARGGAGPAVRARSWRKVRENKPQPRWRTAPQQFRNVLGAFEIVPATCLRRPGAAGRRPRRLEWTLPWSRAPCSWPAAARSTRSCSPPRSPADASAPQASLRVPSTLFRMRIRIPNSGTGPASAEPPPVPSSDG